jgi:hypothetical protein
MAPRRRIEGPVMDEVIQLALRHRHYSPTQIHRMVNEGSDPELVSLRTVQRVISDVRARDESGDWDLGTGEPEDIPLVLPVVRLLAEQRLGRPSKNEARWTVRIRRAYPEISDLELIAQCAAYGARGEPFVGMVEQLLMYAPWRDEGIALGEAVARGDVPFNVAFSFGFENASANASSRASQKGAIA